MQIGYGLTFGVSAAIAVVAAIMMITRRNAVHSAVWLAANFAAVGALYLTLHAQFIAVLQVTIYAGAIMVLFLFVVMLLNVEADEKRDPLRAVAIVGVILGGVLTAAIGITLGSTVPMAGEATLAAPRGTVEDVGLAMLTEYAFAFEFVSVLLVAAMVGVVVLGIRRRHRSADSPEEAD